MWNCFQTSWKIRWSGVLSKDVQRENPDWPTWWTWMAQWMQGEHWTLGILSWMRLSALIPVTCPFPNWLCVDQGSGQRGGQKTGHTQRVIISSMNSAGVGSLVVCPTDQQQGQHCLSSALITHWECSLSKLAKTSAGGGQFYCAFLAKLFLKFYFSFHYVPFHYNYC